MYTGNRIKGSNPFLSAKAERPCVARAFRFVLDKRDSKGGEANAAVRRPPAPESDGPAQRSLEDKLPGAFAENLVLCAKVNRLNVSAAPKARNNGLFCILEKADYRVSAKKTIKTWKIGG